MITLKDRAKAGQTTYRATGTVWDGDDHQDVPGCDGEYQTLAAAKLVARSWLAKGARHFLVTRGTYRAQDIADAQHGTIATADWERDESWICNGQAAGGGAIQWETETW